MRTQGMAQRTAASIETVNMRRGFRFMLDEQEFLSANGIRAVRNITATIATPSRE